ncbi:hypothetical protein N7478_007690 [Penicillium angulare]|uniref:uncharacterized protein n=1 Tax=Penicillium angulare TaxID=116970 RepID=UPI00253FFB8B|nr:uncharacterized protein N7478_007690 [Penicillium angulare]KAJ5272565.1 hypothetical protein N7478_007690 [Penicillium angulare]
MHRFILSGAFILATLASLSFAAPAEDSQGLTSTLNRRMSSDDKWGQFCDDSDCSDNCGEWVNMADTGCLNEGGRGSFYVRDSTVDAFFMIASADGDCPCQTSCDGAGNDRGTGWKAGDSCHQLDSDMQSYRFVFADGTCPDDEC